MAPFQLPAATRIGRVRLRVGDLERSLRFYRDLLGFHPVDPGLPPAPVLPRRVVGLGTRPDAPPLVLLEEVPGARPPGPRTTGLYHYALLFPDRRSLARAVVRLAEAGWPFEGFSDHLVSEAVYLRDPDGNGLELYADRPRSAWRYRGQEVEMATRPLDLEGLLRELEPEPPPEDGIPAGTVVGHVHLHVSDLGRAEAFYQGLLGLAVMNRTYPGALFLAAGGYHHHVAVNIWAGAGAPPPPPEAAGLVYFELVVPGEDAREALLRRLEGQGVAAELLPEGLLVRDPDGIGILIGGG
ncbi:MAG: VOC family protein [Firmicutes bacterium]|nr:VOC family protein [Bacillota bacterium]